MRLNFSSLHSGFEGHDVSLWDSVTSLARRGCCERAPEEDGRNEEKLFQVDHVYVEGAEKGARSLGEAECDDKSLL